MSWLKRWWVVVVVGVSIVAGTVAAFCVNDEKNSIAAYAAVVGTVSILLAVEKHFRDRWKEDEEQKKKDDDNRESLTATLEFRSYETTAAVLGVELYNAGKVTVPIKRVRFVAKDGEKDVVMAMTCTDFKTTVHMRDGPIQTSEYRDRHDLEPRQHARFHLDAFHPLNPEAVLAMKPEALFIVVESFSGEVVRVPGEAIQEVFKKVKPRKR